MPQPSRPDRSASPEVRNPLLTLPAAVALGELLADDPVLAARFRALLRQLGAQADARADASWRARKAPMAAYWRAVAVYARHTAAAVRSTARGASAQQAGPDGSAAQRCSVRV